MLHWETARWSDIKNKKQEGNERNTADVFGVTAKLWINSRKCRKIHQSQITSQESVFLNVSITKVWGLALISSRPPLSHVTALSPPPHLLLPESIQRPPLSHHVDPVDYLLFSFIDICADGMSSRNEIPVEWSAPSLPSVRVSELRWPWLKFSPTPRDLPSVPENLVQSRV